ncbi:MAG: Rho termination factor N-terminal domain-containing protein [Oscillospiraceae bacterium]|nr:Rho termination factor N-terminal domain-containing protein [Oscillospiraceae bacterium]
MAKQHASKDGNCYMCKKTLGETAMKNHVLKEHDTGSEESFLLKIESADFRDYWLYIDIPHARKLESLDRFLREIWLECCGHMSCFTASHNSYGNISKSRTIGSFKEGDKIFYEYDMGTTTALHVKFIGEIKRPKQSSAVRLLARNIPPVLPCFVCGSPAKFVCTECMYNPDESVGAVYCQKHAAKHEHDDMMMPITNSPRSGECGYDGDLDIYAFDEKNAGKIKAASSKADSGSVMESMDMLNEMFSGDFDESKFTDENIMKMFDAMKNMLVTPGEPVFTLREIYAANNVAALREICEMEEIKGCSKMKKNELIDAIIENHINGDKLKSVFSILTEDEFQLLNENLENDFFVAGETILKSVIPISARIFVVFESEGEYRCVIPKEIKELYKTFAEKEDFSEMRGKAQKLRNYIKAAVNLYGVIKIADFTEIYNKYNNTVVEFEIMNETLTALGASDENYGFLDDYLVHGSFFGSEKIKNIVNRLSELQENKPRYIPPNEEFLRYADDDYYEETPEVAAFKDYLKKNGRKNQDDLNDVVIKMNRSIKKSLNKPLDFARILNETGFQHKPQADAKKSLEAAMAMYGNTRTWINNGHSPNEINS